MAFPAQRVVTPELMDRGDVALPALRRSLGFLRRVNRFLSGRRAVLGHLRRWSRRWPRDPRRPIRILDLATGGADIPLAIARWAGRAGHHVQVTAVDRQEPILRLAAEYVRGSDEGGPRHGGTEARRHGGRGTVELVCADALRLPFLPRSFDYVVASLFLHHLPDIEVATMLAIMDRLACRGIIWNDLLRHRRAYWWIRLLTLSADPVVRHDAPASVAAAFRKEEVLGLRDRLDLGYLHYQRHFGHRFTLAGER